MKHLTLTIFMLAGSTALACEKRLDPRRPPVEGEAKQGTADYKLENSLMMALRKDVREGVNPDGYRAETIPAEWSNSRGDDVRLSNDEEGISVHRRATGCFVRVVRATETFELWIPPGGFLDVFRWRGPNVGLLTCLVEGLRENPDLKDWELVEK